MLIQSEFLVLLVVHRDCNGILESHMAMKATFPTYTGTRTHLLYLGGPLAIVRPEGGGDDLRVTRDARGPIGNWSPIDACLEAHGRFTTDLASNAPLIVNFRDHQFDSINESDTHGEEGFQGCRFARLIGKYPSMQKWTWYVILRIGMFVSWRM